MSRSRCILLALMLLVAWAVTVGSAAESDGERADNLMTRRVPRLVEGIGRVEFPITCQRQLTQLYFNQAVAWLHVGDARQADAAFYHAAWLEPECAMAWWGLGMSNAENLTLAGYYASRAKHLSERVTGRERRWIAALADYVDEGTLETDRRVYLTRSLDRIATEFPDDLEAKAFLVRQFLDNRDVGLPIPFTTAADALINEVLRVRPDHPIHHYRIRLWEQDQPQRAAASAEHVQRTMSEAPLVLTAAGRLFARLANDERALVCFEASAAAAQRRMRDQRLCPGEVEGYVQNMEQMITLLARMGRSREAISLAKQLIELPACRPPVVEPAAATRQHAAPPPPAKEQADPTTTGQRLLLDLLRELQLWDELLALEPSAYFQSDDLDIQARRAYALSLAHVAQWDAAGVAEDVRAMRQLARQLSSQHSNGADGRELVRRVQAYLAELAIYEELLNAAPVSEVVKTDAGLGETPAKPTAEAGVRAETAWEPLLAPRFVLPDRHGDVISLKSFRGRPVVLVFYLGAGCPHCIEQLQSFAPLREDFERAGVTVIAVSTDSIEGLNDTFTIAGAGEAIPFLLASDQQLGAFREFGAFDRRENKPLHGTFLIDPRGRIVWQNISREPFMATRQLLGEAKRVIALDEFAQRDSTSVKSGSE